MVSSWCDHEFVEPLLQAPVQVAMEFGHSFSFGVGLPAGPNNPMQPCSCADRPGPSSAPLCRQAQMFSPLTSAQLTDPPCRGTAR